MNHGSRALLLGVIFLLAAAPRLYSDNVSEDQISVAVPASELSRLASTILPIKINPNDVVLGDLWVESIRNLRFGKNKVLCSLRLRGKDAKYTLRLGETPVIIEVGDLDVTFDVEGLFRFDNAAGTLYVKPIIVGNSEAVAQNGPMVSLLALLSGVEYPIPVGNLAPLVFESNGRKFQLYLSLVDVFSDNAGVYLKANPKLVEKGP